MQPGHPKVLAVRGEAHRGQPHYREAAADLEACLVREPDQRDVFNGLAWLDATAPAPS